MQNTVFMGVVDRARHLGDEFSGLADRYWRLFNYFVELAAFNKVSC
jgi:hypothetical protein